MDGVRIIRLSFNMLTSAPTPQAHRKVLREGVTSAIRAAESVSEFSKEEAENLIGMLAEREEQ